MHIQTFMGGEYVGHHRHLDISGDAQFTLDALLGSRRLFQFVVGMLQLRMRHLQTVRGLTLVERIGNEECHDEHKGDTSVDEPLLGETLFLLGYLGFFLLGVVHRGQLCGIVLFGSIDGTVEGIADLFANGDGGILAVCTNVSTVFG